MATIQQMYRRIEDLEEKLDKDLYNAKDLSDNFCAYADFSREYLRAIGKEVDYSLVERAVRESKMMKKVYSQLDKTTHSYNDLVNELSHVRRDSIAKHLVTTEGCDDVHTITEILEKYGIDPDEDMFSKAVHLISQTRKSVIEKKYEEKVVKRVEFLLPNNMQLQEFIFLVNGYATSAYRGVGHGA